MNPQTLKNVAASYERDGYAVIENFLNEDELLMIKNETTRVIEEDPEGSLEKMQIFGNEYNMQSRYFLESNDKIRFFFEKKSINKDTSELLMPQDKGLAKIGHALHYLEPKFKQVTTSEKVKDVFRALGFVEPVVSQSMVIFKNSKCGGAYSAHQDASFIYTEPLHLVGFWLALDDATVENGCLEFIPGSHKGPLARRFVRTGNTQDGENLLDWTAPVRDEDEKQFVKVPIKRGGLVLIHGLVVHRSAQNLSDKSRWAYTFHAWDKAKSIYSDKNWNAPSNAFMSVYAN